MDLKTQSLKNKNIVLSHYLFTKWSKSGFKVWFKSGFKSLKNGKRSNGLHIFHILHTFPKAGTNRVSIRVYRYRISKISSTSNKYYFDNNQNVFYFEIIVKNCLDG